MHTADDDVDDNRRRFLTRSANVVGLVGAGFVAVPFLASWSPSERARAAGAPVEADISKLAVGERMIVEYRGKPIWIVRRSEAMMASLDQVSELLADPDSSESVQPEYATNQHRSRDKMQDLLVMEGVCTHLGCSPSFRPDIAPADLGADWYGGFFCPCHGSKFDLAGRVYKGVPAPRNMPVPPYQYLNDGATVLIGDDSEIS